MRWRYIDPNNQAEVAERNAIVARIDAWWQEFAGKTQALSDLFSQKSDWDLPGWMERHLQGIHPDLMWEFGPAVNGPGHRLIITPESAHHLRPLAQTILERAPTLQGWEFYGNRLPESLELAKQSVEGRTGLPIDDFRVKVSRGEQQFIDLVYTSPTVAEMEDSDAFHAAFVATESLLGEECLNHWIGAIEVAPTGDLPPQHFIELGRLKERVDALIGSLYDQLPPEPHSEWAADAEWTLWELEAEQADDYARQADLVIGKSANPAQWTAGHAGSLFCSDRFSRCGETFCYVKIDGTNGLDAAGFADKSEIEEALETALLEEDLGCPIGGGTGLRYSYIDLALTDVERGIQAVKRCLQAGKVPRRSWIQFYDSDLAAEWVGIYDNTPAPPMDLEG